MAQLLSEGHIELSYVPDRKHRELFALVVQRSKLIKEKSSEINCIQKILTASNTQLSNVVSVVYGKSAQILLKETLKYRAPSLDHIKRLQEQKKVSPHLKSTPEELSAALEGVMTEDSRLHLKKLEEHVGFLDKQIDLDSCKFCAATGLIFPYVLLSVQN